MSIRAQPRATEISLFSISAKNGGIWIGPQRWSPIHDDHAISPQPGGLHRPDRCAPPVPAADPILDTLVSAGKIPAIRLGRKILFRRVDIIAYLDSCLTPAPDRLGRREERLGIGAAASCRSGVHQTGGAHGGASEARAAFPASAGFSADAGCRRQKTGRRAWHQVSLSLSPPAAPAVGGVPLSIGGIIRTRKG